MRLTISTIAIAAAAFAATFVFAPAVADIGQQLTFETVVTQPAPAAATVKERRNCRSPLGMIVDALGEKECV